MCPVPFLVKKCAQFLDNHRRLSSDALQPQWHTPWLGDARRSRTLCAPQRTLRLLRPWCLQLLALGTTSATWAVREISKSELRHIHRDPGIQLNPSPNTSRDQKECGFLNLIVGNLRVFQSVSEAGTGAGSCELSWQQAGVRGGSRRARNGLSPLPSAPKS